jgi:uncharacterized membrane protein
MPKNRQTFECPICHNSRTVSESRPQAFVSEPVRDLIRGEHPGWSRDDLICLSCLRQFRHRYLQQALEDQKGELSEVEQTVLTSLVEHEMLSRNVNPEFDKALTPGQRIADKVASFGGSWAFIIIFGSVLLAWIVVNSVVLMRRPFDPYPYILLNLILSCLAAIQAPIIMMSQNRQEARDRLRAEHDYEVNLKAEIEIRQLHVKLDQLINHSWHRLLDIQQVQIDLMEELAEFRKK